MQVIGWLTLLICLWTTADQVIDLVFEEPEVTVEVDVTAEEPDNAAEHVLMPSARAGGSSAGTVTTTSTSDLETISIAIPVNDNAAQIIATSYHPPPRSRPVSFSVPLRI